MFSMGGRRYVPLLWTAALRRLLGGDSATDLAVRTGQSQQLYTFDKHTDVKRYCSDRFEPRQTGRTGVFGMVRLWPTGRWAEGGACAGDRARTRGRDRRSIRSPACSWGEASSLLLPSESAQSLPA